MPKQDEGEIYNQLMERLKQLMKENNYSPDNKTEIDRLKIEINNIRRKHGLAVFAQLKDFKDLELKPYKYPGDPDPAQPITTCTWCGSSLNENEKVCHNCGQTQIFKGQPYKRKVPDKGETQSPFGTNRDKYINPVIPLSRAASNKDKLKRNKKNSDYAKNDPDTVKEVFVSDTIHQCLEPKRKNRENVDIRKEEIMRSCEDLAIDG